MKKIVLLVLAVMMLFTLAACGGESTDDSAAPALSEVMDAVIAGTNSEIAVINGDVTEDRFFWFFGIDYVDGSESYASEAAIGSIAHSVALLRVPEGTDAAALASEIENNADPRKWICVEAEKTVVKQSDDIILVAMTSESDADIISANFDTYFA